MGLVEALVALAVLTVGVMGMTSLQTRTLLESRASNGRAAAVRLVNDLGERMRSNPGIRAFQQAGGPHPYQITWGETPSPVNCWQVACQPHDLARFDLAQWHASITQLLPGGDARVFRSETDPAFLVVQVGWPLLPADTPVLAAPGNTPGHCRAGLVCHQVHLRP